MNLNDKELEDLFDYLIDNCLSYIDVIYYLSLVGGDLFD